MSVETPLGATPQGGALEITSTSAVLEHAHTLRRRGTRTWTQRVALAATAGVPLLGMLLCVAGTHTDALLAQTIQPVPPSMAGPFYHIGFSLSTGVVIAAVVSMLVAYLVAVKYVEHVSARVVIGAVVVLNVIALLGPPMFSTDVFSYQAYARMFAIYHINPYTHGPSVIQLDVPLYNFIGAKWINTPSVYGPLFTFLSGAFASSSISFSEFAFKLIAAAAIGGTLYFLWKAAQLRGLNPVRAVALFGLSPLVTIFGVGGGHNDLLMLLFTTAGIYAMLSRRERGAGGLMMAGAAVKLTGALVLPFALLSGVELDARRRRRAFLIGAAAVTVVIAAASDICFGTGILHLKNTLQRVQDEGSWQSLPGFLFSILGLSVTHAVRTVETVLLASWLLWLLRRVWQGRMDWIDGAAWATFGVLLAAWALLPWYASWLLPLVALGTSRRLWTAATVMTVIAGAIMVADSLPYTLNL